MKARSVYFMVVSAAIINFALTASAQKKEVILAKTDFKIFFEKVYLHIDRDVYASGENIWFKAYLLDAQNNISTNSSKNLSVELIAADGKLVDQEFIRLNSGSGNGDFTLSDSIPPGKYSIRAYTNWMRNFGDLFFFEKQITVFGSKNLSNKPSQNIAKLLAERALSLAVTSEKPSVKEAPPTIRFFPEGGSMIENVAGLVAFKAEDHNGNGVAVKGSIYSVQGDTIIHFESTSLGLGSFSILPEVHTKYLIKGVFNNKIPFAATLPATLKKGFALHVAPVDSNGFRLTVSTNQTTLQDLPNRAITLTGRHAGRLFLNEKISFNALQFDIRVSKTQFPTGISTLTVYDEQGRPQCERLIFVEDDKPLNTSFTTDKLVYLPKEKVTLKIKITDANRQPVRANLSVAVADENFTDKNSINLKNYLELQSELRGEIKNPEIYFDTTYANRLKKLDLLLLTQGWRTYLWRSLADTAINISYLPERGFEVSGRLRQKFANQPLAGKNIALTVLGSAMKNRYNAVTDTAGKFHISNIELYGKQSVTIAATDEKDRKIGLELDTTSKKTPAIKSISMMETDTATARKQLQFAAGFYKRQSLLDTVRLKGITVKSSKFLTLRDATMTSFGYPDETLNVTVKDYHYVDLKNYILHISKQAHMENDPLLPRSDAIVFFAEGKKWYPRLIVNNKEIPFTDNDPNEVFAAYYNQYYNLPIDKVEKVVIRRMLKPAVMVVPDPTSVIINGMGTPVSPGSRIEEAHPIFIIYLTIKPNVLQNINANSTSTELSGYYQSRVFYAPKYDQPETNKASDLRTTIHWEPNVITNKNGEAIISFYNTGSAGRIKITTEGASTEGKPITNITFYEVKI